MAKMPEYPLAQVLTVKNRRVEEAERVVKKREAELAAEKEKLRKCEEARDKVKQHLKDKYDQLRCEFDKGTSSDKVLQIKAYIEVVKERLAVEEKKVEEQKKQVKIAEDNLKQAREELIEKRKEVDKLEKHRDKWLKEMKKEMELVEAVKMNEIGSIMYSSNKKLKKEMS